jgi:hypothetical protein
VCASQHALLLNPAANIQHTHRHWILRAEHRMTYYHHHMCAFTCQLGLSPLESDTWTSVMRPVSSGKTACQALALSYKPSSTITKKRSGFCKYKIAVNFHWFEWKCHSSVRSHLNQVRLFQICTGPGWQECRNTTYQSLVFSFQGQYHWRNSFGKLLQ